MIDSALHSPDVDELKLHRLVAAGFPTSISLKDAYKRADVTVVHRAIFSRASAAAVVRTLPFMEDWRIVIGLQPDDPPDLRTHLNVFYPEYRHHLVEWLRETPLGDSDRQLLLDVAADDAEGAEEAAIDLYDKAREHAGLETKAIFLIGYSRLNDLEPLHSRLLAQAELQAMGGEYAFAIVLAQTACEVSAREVLEAGLRRDKKLAPLAKALPRSVLFRDGVSQAAFELLAGSPVRDEDWWAAHDEHYRRRNGIVHSGLSVTKTDAEQSLEICNRFLARMTELEAA